MQLLDLSLLDWLEELGGRSAAPAGGSAAALAGAMAAALVAMTARLSEHWKEGAGVAAQAAALRVRLAGLVQADADVYEESLAALKRRSEIPDERRDFELGNALARAAQTPLLIAEAAADVALIAADAAERADERLQADAEAAVALAAAAAQSAARLVEVNLAAKRDDPRVAQARAAAEAATRAMRRSFPPT